MHFLVSVLRDYLTIRNLAQTEFVALLPLLSTADEPAFANLKLFPFEVATACVIFVVPEHCSPLETLMAQE